VTTVADAQAMQAAIAGSQLAELQASHLSNLEAPEAFEQALAGFAPALDRRRDDRLPASGSGRHGL
jgi:pimeloyl-ACP methyl ester carboxylesterase